MTSGLIDSGRAHRMLEIIAKIRDLESELFDLEPDTLDFRIFRSRGEMPTVEGLKELIDWHNQEFVKFARVRDRLLASSHLRAPLLRLAWVSEISGNAFEACICSSQPCEAYARIGTQAANECTRFWQRAADFVAVVPDQSRSFSQWRLAVIPAH